MKQQKLTVGKELAMGLLFLTIAGQTANAAVITSYTVPKGNLMAEDVVVNLTRARLRFDQEAATPDSPTPAVTATLDYSLPMELDGTTPHRFVLTGQQQDSVWKMASADQKVKADCVGDQKDFQCAMVYATNADGIFQLNTASANAYLETRTDLAPAQVQKFKEAQVVLQHEPIGIVRSRKR